MAKLIREIRMGPPKTYKTGAVVSSYPRPLLVFEGDDGGLDIIKEPIVWIKPDDLEHYIIDQKIAPLTAVQFTKPSTGLNDLWQPAADNKSFIDFNKAGNALFTRGCPFRTVVIDPITKLSEIILGAYAQANSKKMEDARKWASGVGQKVSQTIAAFFTLPCHVVVIMHTSWESTRNAAGEVLETHAKPMIYSAIRDMLGSLPSQFFYQDAKSVGGKPQPYVQTVPDSKIKGIGCRWPTLDAEVANPTFQNIYGKAVQSGETSV